MAESNGDFSKVLERRKHEEATIIKWVFENIEGAHEDDIDVLGGAARIRLRKFTPTWHGDINHDDEESPLVN